MRYVLSIVLLAKWTIDSAKMSDGIKGRGERERGEGGKEREGKISGCAGEAGVKLLNKRH